MGRIHPRLAVTEIFALAFEVADKLAGRKLSGCIFETFRP
jgi:hypothetical protein